MPLAVGTRLGITRSLARAARAEWGKCISHAYQAQFETPVQESEQKYHDAAWDLRFVELKAYRRQHGHCQVPSRSKTHPSLGYWG